MQQQTNISPPDWANRFLEWYCHPNLIDEIQGDLTEQFHKNSKNKGQLKARFRFIIDVIRFFRPSSLKQTQYFMNLDIIANYLKVAFRVFKKEKGYTFTNITGLALGITCSLFIYLWVQDELKYNQWSDDNELIHYVRANMPQDDGTVTWESTPYPLKAVLEEKYPSIDLVAATNWGSDIILKKGEEKIQSRGLFASPSIFEIFSIKPVKGAYEEMEKNETSIAISEKMATRYFGEDWRSQDVIGTMVTTHKGNQLTLAAIFEDIPRHSTMKFDYIIPFKARLANSPWIAHWGNYSNRTFVKINPSYNTETATANMQKAVQEHRPDVEDNAILFLQPFADRYLKNNYVNGSLAGGRIDYVRLLSVAAILILLLASINFINLSTARAAKRSKEAGVRKVMGAVRQSLRTQFIVESLLITGFAFIISSLLVYFLLPYFNFLTGKSVGVEVLTLEFVMLALGFVLTLGLLSGLYPALYMARMDPIRALKGILKGDRSNQLLRKGLVVFQFAITTIMIVGSITVYRQIQYIFEKNTGMDRENVIKAYMGDMEYSKDFQVYRNRLSNMPGIQSIATTDQDPLSVGNSTSDPSWPGKNPEFEKHFYVTGIDPNYIPTLDIKLKDGRNFDWDLATDTANYIINETCAKIMGLENPVGTDLSFWENDGKIIGVIEDFHFHSLHTPIEPLILRYDKEPWMILVKTKMGETKEAIASLEELHKEFNPARNFNFDLLDEQYNNRYKSEILVSKLTLYFTAMAIIISCLGLLGLVSFATQLKTKEIGIRKVLGASVSNILGIISKEYLIMVIISIVVACPISYVVLQDWLNGFAYQIDLSIWLFVSAGIVSVLLTLIIIGEQGIRAALRNPVESLRDE
ncbi:MAG: permease prefix domain 2-containing transporter [bacterium]|nr:permease prefix domain 2-containing transporter [bacterium]